MDILSETLVQLCLENVRRTHSSNTAKLLAKIKINLHVFHCEVSHQKMKTEKNQIRITNSILLSVVQGARGTKNAFAICEELED